MLLRCSGQYLILHRVTINSLKHAFQCKSKVHRTEGYKMSTGNQQRHIQKKCYSFKIPKQSERGLQLNWLNNRSWSYFFVTVLGWPVYSSPACCRPNSRALNQRFAGLQSVGEFAYITNTSLRQPTVSYYSAISHPACLTRAHTYCVGQCRGSKIS